jgi:hypothetical protein
VQTENIPGILTQYRASLVELRSTYANAPYYYNISESFYEVDMNKLIDETIINIDSVIETFDGTAKKDEAEHLAKAAMNIFHIYDLSFTLQNRLAQAPENIIMLISPAIYCILVMGAINNSVKRYKALRNREI